MASSGVACLSEHLQEHYSALSRTACLMIGWLQGSELRPQRIVDTSQRSLKSQLRVVKTLKVGHQLSSAQARAELFAQQALRSHKTAESYLWNLVLCSQAISSAECIISLGQSLLEYDSEANFPLFSCSKKNPRHKGLRHAHAPSSEGKGRLLKRSKVQMRPQTQPQLVNPLI